MEVPLEVRLGRMERDKPALWDSVPTLSSEMRLAGECSAVLAFFSELARLNFFSSSRSFLVMYWSLVRRSSRRLFK
jgi:hypothetical protein